MSDTIDETGNRYGKLVVIKREENNDRGAAQWLCKCDCGNEKVVSGYRLRSGYTTSCGCFRNSFKLPRGHATRNQLYNSYKQSAKRRGLFWGITLDNFAKLTKQNCYYCGIEPKQSGLKGMNHQRNGDYIYNGIDRVDNDKGYTLDNVVTCCGTCNNMKRTLSKRKFIDQVMRIAKHITNVTSNI